jgi:hypothetical protein
MTLLDRPGGRAARRGRVSRVLVAVLPGDEAVALASLTTVTRAAPRARIRVACFRPLPPARRDRHDRVAADTDAEMDRIGRAAVAGFDAAARDLEHAGLGIVVRFGAPAREAAVEAEVYDAHLAVVFAPPPGAPVRRARTWWLRRVLAARARVQTLVVDMPRAADARPLRTPAAATS